MHLIKVTFINCPSPQKRGYNLIKLKLSKSLLGNRFYELKTDIFFTYLEYIINVHSKLVHSCLTPLLFSLILLQ